MKVLVFLRTASCGQSLLDAIDIYKLPLSMLFVLQPFENDLSSFDSDPSLPPSGYQIATSFAASVASMLALIKGGYNDNFVSSEIRDWASNLKVLMRN